MIRKLLEKFSTPTVTCTIQGSFHPPVPLYYAQPVAGDLVKGQRQYIHSS